jgi:phosphate-selective porin OprO/OprP
MVHPRSFAAIVGLAIGAACWLALPSAAADERGEAEFQGLDPGALFAGNGGAEDTTPAATPPAPDAAAVPSADEPKPIAGYDKGFFVQSRDGKFRLNLNAKLQARYTYFGKDEHQASDGSDESYFELERARIGFSGHFFDPTLRFKIELEAETDGSDKGVLMDTWIQYAPRAEFAVGVGQFKPAFLREEYMSSFKGFRVDRSLANEFFNIDRNIGIWVEGETCKHFYYNLGVTNGIDTVNRAPGGGDRDGTQLDQPPAYVAKLDLTLSGDHAYSYEGPDLKGLDTPLLVVGVSGLQQTYNATHEDNAFIDVQGDVYGYGLDAIFKYKGISVMGEYMGRWWDGEDDGTDALYAHGFTLQGGAFLLRDPDIELTARYSAVYGNEGPNDGDGHEVGPGINWYFTRSHNGKLQLDVAYIDISQDLPVQTELLRNPNTFETTAAGFSAGEQGVLTRVQVQLTF